MTAALESLEGLQRRLTIQLSADKIEQACNRQFGEMASYVSIPGFRPGKVPTKVIKQRYGNSVLADAKQKLLETAYEDALNEYQLRPASRPQVEMVADDVVQGAQFALTFEIFPQIEQVTDLNGSKIDQVTVVINEEDVSEMLERIRVRHATWEDVSEPAIMKDKVIADFEGKIDGVPFDGGAASKVNIILGSKRLIPGFEEGLVGVKEGDKVLLNLTFPENYHSADLAGKATTFDVFIHKVQRQILPEVDEQFIKDYGVSAGTIEAFRDNIRKQMERTLKKSLQNDLRTKVFDCFIEKNPIEVPAALIEAEAKKLQQEAVAQMQMQMGNKQQINIPTDLYRKDGKRRVVLGLLLAKFIEDHKIQTSSDRISQFMEEVIDDLCATWDVAHRDMLTNYFQSTERQQEAQIAVLEQQVVEELLKTAEVNTIEKKYFEFMAQE